MYLIYDNPARLVWSKNVDACSSDQLEALKTALVVGRVLKRIVILPRFHCVNKKTQALYECPLNSFIFIPNFDSKFKSSYRESSFLYHPLVPDAVRTSVTSQRTVIDGMLNQTSSLATVTSDELLRRFGNVTERVLRLESLYNQRVQFTSNELQQEFTSTIENAITECDYRQQFMKNAPHLESKEKKRMRKRRRKL
jgi:hypothetical protein